jgi:hypothetical protein
MTSVNTTVRVISAGFSLVSAGLMVLIAIAIGWFESWLVAGGLIALAGVQVSALLSEIRSGSVGLVRRSWVALPCHIA